jgi:ectoine hydroxylase-related dioxygenase (phytanoyl-CoA dioxygenase family)
VSRFDYEVTDTQREIFDRDGAVLLESVIDNELLARLETATERARDYPGGFWYKIYLWRRDPDFRDCAMNSPLPGIAAQFLRRDKLTLLYDQLFVKPPRGEPTPWHNDLPYWPVEGTSVMSIWLALSEVTKRNGGLEFVRGSHRWSRRFHPFTANPEGTQYAPHDDTSSEYETLPDFDAERDRHDIVHWDMRPGDAVAFHSLTVHHAGSNQSTRQPRKGYALRFMGDDVRYRLAPSMNEYVLNSALNPGDRMDSEQYPIVFQG